MTETGEPFGNSGGRMREAQREPRFVLIEGPDWGKALFLGKWILAAAKAETLRKKAFADPKFRQRGWTF